MVYSDNRYLSKDEMTVNAQYIVDYLISKGWTKNSISGMLGNMETESTINPGIWQSLAVGNMNLGYGLVQWTPASKYISWANQEQWHIGDIDGQLERLQFEIDNKIQWIKTTSYPMTFQEFKESKFSPEYLAQAFLRNYERPKNPNQPIRSTQARYWFDNLTGGEGVSKPFFPTTEGTPISSRYGWRKDPFTGEEKFHDGTDFASGGQPYPIYATQKGEIIRNAFDDVLGNYVRIQHTGDKYFSGYQHLALLSTKPVGSSVEKGEQIGLMGTTGSSTGVHLHFQIATRIDGWYTESGTIDPEIYLEMEFGDGGGSDPKPPSENDLNKNIITLLMCDALNGWKW